MVWENVVDVFRQSIEHQGYYYYPKPFPVFVKEHGLDAPQPTPSYLSLDFWSQQRKELTRNGWYVIRLGR